MAQQLTDNVKGITVVPVDKVLQFQAENIYWDSMDKTALASQLGAGKLLYVTIIEFGTHQPGSEHLYQGHMIAEAAVYDAKSSEAQSRQWYGSDLTATYPKDAPIGNVGADDREIRYQTQKQFAQHLVEYFYNHKEPVQS